MTHNGTTYPEASLAGHGIPKKINSQSINVAVNRWERRQDEEPFILCGYDGIYRKPSAIRALIVVQ